MVIIISLSDYELSYPNDKYLHSHSFTALSFSSTDIGFNSSQINIISFMVISTVSLECLVF